MPMKSIKSMMSNHNEVGLGWVGLGPGFLFLPIKERAPSGSGNILLHGLSDHHGKTCKACLLRPVISLQCVTSGVLGYPKLCPDEGGRGGIKYSHGWVSPFALAEQWGQWLLGLPFRQFFNKIQLEFERV